MRGWSWTSSYSVNVCSGRTQNILCSVCILKSVISCACADYVFQRLVQFCIRSSSHQQSSVELAVDARASEEETADTPMYKFNFSLLLILTFR